MRWLLYLIAAAVILFIVAFAALKISQHTIGGGHYSIPTGSMMPTLRPGDQIAALPVSGMPDRGDVVLFRKPSNPQVTYIFRVIAIAGDRIELREGVPILNGIPLAQVRTDPFEIKQPRDSVPHCRKSDVSPDGICQMQQVRETLPDGRNYHVLNTSDSRQDNTEEFVVPEGHFFVLGDNRDNALDSRFPDTGMIPVENLTGHAVLRLIGRDVDGGVTDRSLSRIE